MKTVTYDERVWKLVPVEPTQKMIVEGFESEPNDYFTDQNELERYKALSGCRQAAYRASKCWSAMLKAAPTPPEVEQAQPDELKSVLAAARQAGWSFEKRADGVTHMVRLVVGEVQAQPEASAPSMSPLVRDLLTFALWHHQGGSSSVGQSIRALLGMRQHECMTEAQYEVARRVQRLIAQQPSAQDREDATPGRDAVDLARAGMELHKAGQPEYIVCKELVRIADARAKEADHG